MEEMEEVRFDCIILLVGVSKCSSIAHFKLVLAATNNSALRNLDRGSTTGKMKVSGEENGAVLTYGLSSSLASASPWLSAMS